MTNTQQVTDLRTEAVKALDGFVTGYARKEHDLPPNNENCVDVVLAVVAKYVELPK